MKTRFRPTLQKYRTMEKWLSIADDHIKLGTEQMKKLQEAYEFQEAISNSAMSLYRDAIKDCKNSARLNWFLLALVAAYAFKDVYQYITL